MRTFVLLLAIVLAFTCFAENQEKSREKSRQFPFDWIPTQPPPPGLRPTTRKTSLLQSFMGWLSPTEPPVLYPDPEANYYHPETPGIRPHSSFWPGFYGYTAPRPSYLPQYIPQQNVPSRLYQRVPVRHPGYRPAGPPLSPTYGYRPSTYSGYQPSRFPYSGETAPFPAYDPSGVAAETVLQPVYKAPSAQVQPPKGNTLVPVQLPKVQTASKASALLAKPPQIYNYPVHKTNNNPEVSSQSTGEHTSKHIFSRQPYYEDPAKKPNNNPSNKQTASSSSYSQQQSNPPVHKVGPASNNDSVQKPFNEGNSSQDKKCECRNEDAETSKIEQPGVSGGSFVDIRSNHPKEVITIVEAPDLTKPDNYAPRE